MIGYSKRSGCASCESQSLERLLDLGTVPLAGHFPSKLELGKENKYPLNLMFCENCKLVQTDSVIEPDILFKDYRYISSVGLSGHFQSLAKILDQKYRVKEKDILEIGCNDGVLLEPLVKLGAFAEGVDPAENIVKIARDKGLKVTNAYFNYENFKSKEYQGKFDLVLCNNAFAHIIDIKEIIKGVNHVLKPSGDFIFEVHYLKDIIEGNQWDSIYHEHIYYYSLTALRNLFKKFDMTIIDFEEIPIHSGSIRVTVKNQVVETPKKLLDRYKLEEKNICNLEFLSLYRKNTISHINEFKEAIRDLGSKYKIGGYGASGRANMFCNLTNLNEEKVQFIVDESPERCGRYMANTKIPIVDVNYLKESDIDLLIIFAWNYSKMIIEKTQFKNLKYLVAFPFVQVVENYTELEGFDSI